MEKEKWDFDNIKKFTRMKRDGYLGKDHGEWSEKCFGKRYSEDVARRMFYGTEKTLDAYDNKTNKKSASKKCLVINDIHLPFEREDVLNVIRENKDVDYIIIGGDLIDCVSCTSFDTMNRPSVEDELVYAYKFINKINQIVDASTTKIIAIEGNHEARYKKTIIRMMEKQMQSLLNPALLSMLSEGFTVYPNGKRKVYDPIVNFEYIDSWYTRMFDGLIVAHPLNFSNVGGKVSEQISEYMLNQGIADKDDVIVFGHTHKFSMIKNNRRQGMFVVENGCLCKEHEYAKTGKLAFTQQNYGYTVIEFNDGEKINPNNVRFIHLD